MITPIVIAGSVFLGKEAFQLIAGLAKIYVNRRFEKFLSEVEVRMGGEERSALTLAYEDAMANGFSAALDVVSNVLRMAGVDDEEMRRHRAEVLCFLEDGQVGDVFWDSICDISNSQKPDVLVLEAKWELTRWTLPIPSSSLWPFVAAGFRDAVKKQAFVSSPRREILVAENIDRLVELQEQLLGVQVTVRQDQYAKIMQMRYARVELANVAPAYSEDQGVLIVTDIFEPQHVRENPPPVEITKDEFEELVNGCRSESEGEDAIIALLEAGEGKEVADRLRYLRSSYAEQSVRSVFDAIASFELIGFNGIQAHDRLHVITGEPGSGKSTLLRYLLLGVLSPPVDPLDPPNPLRWTLNFTGKYDCFPLLIELRDYYFTCRDEAEVNCFLDYIGYLGESQGWGVSAKWLHDRLRSGASLVMFDGLDEIFDSRHRDTIMKQIAGFAADYPRSRLIVTSRPHGYHEGILRPAGFAHYRLQDLDGEQKQRFVHAWFSRVFPNSVRDANARSERVINAIERSPSVRWLAGNPLLLTIMCLIAREKELPRERARFYEECVDVLVHKWDLNHHIQIEGLEFLSIDDKKDLLRLIAFRMQASEAGLHGNFISEKELVGIVESWFIEDHELSKVDSKMAAGQMIRGLWERNYLLCPRGPKLYGFLHRTFMEYLTAMEYVRRYQDREIEIEYLRDSIFKENANKPEWAEVLRLICGAVGDNRAEILIRTLLSSAPIPLGDLTDSNRPDHLVLAIRCMGELRGLSKLESLGREVSLYCLEFLRGLETMSFQESFMINDFIPAVDEIAMRWPGVPSLEIDAAEFVEAGSEYFPAFAAIGRNWELIKRWTLNDLGEYPHVSRQTALLTLAKWWPTQDTRNWILFCANDDEEWQVRLKAFEILCKNEEWYDRGIHQSLIDFAISHDEWAFRLGILKLLVELENWYDVVPEVFLSERLVGDSHPNVRSGILDLMDFRSGSARNLLFECIKNDDHFTPRVRSLEIIANNIDMYEDVSVGFWLELINGDSMYQVRSSALSLSVDIVAFREGMGADNLADLLREKACSDDHPAVRCVSFELLLGNSNHDPKLFGLLVARLRVDDSEAVRNKILHLLVAGGFSGAEVRDVLIQFSADSRYGEERSGCLDLMSSRDEWIDDDMRKIMLNLATLDSEESIRAKAVQLLCHHKKWLDVHTVDIVRSIMIDDAAMRPRSAALTGIIGGGILDKQDAINLSKERAIKDAFWQVRQRSLGLLSENESIDPADLLNFLFECAIQDDEPQMRAGALGIISQMENVGEASKEFIKRCLKDDPDESVRVRAVGLLVDKKNWIDDDVRRIVTNLCINDPSEGVRFMAVECLACTPAWVDDNSFSIIRSIASNDVAWSVRAGAFDAMVEKKKWIEGAMSMISELKSIILDGRSGEERGWAACCWGKLCCGGRFPKISRGSVDHIKGLVFSKDGDGLGPYIDPFEPVSREHIFTIANRGVERVPTGIDLDDLIGKLNREFGWNIEIGYCG